MNSINKLVRISRFLYVIVILPDGIAEVFVREGLTVYAYAVSTAQSIFTSEQICRIGFVAALVCLICATFLILILFIKYSAA